MLTVVYVVCSMLSPVHAATAIMLFHNDCRAFMQVAAYQTGMPLTNTVVASFHLVLCDCVAFGNGGAC